MPSRRRTPDFRLTGPNAFDGEGTTFNNEVVPRGRPQQLGLRDADERREVHVLMRELNELHAPFLALKSVSENV